MFSKGNGVSWAPDLNETRTYVVEPLINARVAVEQLDTGVIHPNHLPNVGKVLLRRLRRLCGGDYLIPVRLELQPMCACFGKRDVGFLATGSFDGPKELRSAELVVSYRRDFRLESMYEATDEGARLVLLRLTPSMAADMWRVATTQPVVLEPPLETLPSGRRLDTLVLDSVSRIA